LSDREEQLRHAIEQDDERTEEIARVREDKQASRRAAAERLTTTIEQIVPKLDELARTFADAGRPMHWDPIQADASTYSIAITIERPGQNRNSFSAAVYARVGEGGQIRWSFETTEGSRRHGTTAIDPGTPETICDVITQAYMESLDPSTDRESPA
jgi:hypothetical protein